MSGNAMIVWNNEEHLKLWSHGLAEMYNHRGSADVSIVCGKDHAILKAHRFVLSVSSTYFRDALKATPCKRPTIVVKEISGEAMEGILECIYTGQVKFQSEYELGIFLTAAKYLELTGTYEDHAFVQV